MTLTNDNASHLTAQLQKQFFAAVVVVLQVNYSKASFPKANSVKQPSHLNFQPFLFFFVFF